MKKILLPLLLLLSLCTVVNAQFSVFSDSYGAGGTFVDFGGAINAISIDNTVAHSGTSSLKALVPNSSYVGGAIKAATPQNLSSYNAISFWVKSDATKTLNVSGISNNGNPPATFQTEYINIGVSPTWKKYIIPIPAASKLTAEDGLFHFAEGSDEGPYTLWFDDIQYENSPAVGAFTASFATQTVSPLVGGTFSPGGQSVSVLVNGVSQSLVVNLACFNFTSSNTSVATIVNGAGTAVGAGTATITGTLNGTAATGTITVNVGSVSTPMTAAPTPTRPAANVISLFSNVYVDLPGTNWNPNWGQSTQVSDIQIAGNDTKKYANLNYQGMEFASAINASAMQFLHIDIWTPNCTAFDLFLINPGGVEQPYTVNPTASGWNSFEIPLSAYNTVNLSNIFQIKSVGVPSGTSLVFFDNLYFYKNAAITVPLVAAPIPTRLPANVLSVFSDTYTNIPGTEFFPNWGQSTVVSDILIAGNNTKKYDNLNYQGVQFLAPVDASSMQFLHLDLWTPNCTAFDVFLINPGPIEKEFRVIPTQAGWNSIDIPLTAYNTIALNNIIQFKLVGTPFGGSIVYLDNIYFYKNPALAPLVAAPVPTRLAPYVLSVFSDTYTNIPGTEFFPNWGQSTVVSDVLIAGNNTKKYETLNYQGVQFAAPVDASTMEFLHFDLWTPNCTAFDVFLINAGPIEKEVRVTPTTYGWNSFDIPLSAYNTIALNAIIQFKLVGIPFGSSTVYLDNIYFYKNPPTAPLTAAPTPIKPASTVISLFSNAYTDLPGTDWFPNWGQSTVVSDVLIAGNATKKYTTLNYQGVQFANPVNASAMQFLHLDLWTPNCTAFDVFLINPGPNEQPYTITPTAYGWNSIDIPLTAYSAIALNNIIQFKLVGTPFGSSTVYLDNIYFYNIPSLTVTTNSLTIAAPANSTQTFGVTSNTTWTVSSNQSWLSANIAAGSANGNVILTALANPSPTMRFGAVTVTGANVPTQTIIVGQSAAVASLAVSSNSVSIFAAANSSIAVDVTTNTTWTAVSNASWLTLSSAAGTGDASITMTATANPNTGPRTTTVVVSSPGLPDQIINVSQFGVTILSVSSNAVAIAAPASSMKMVDVTSNTDWTATSNAAWLTLSSATGTGNATLTLTASANPSITSRVALVTISASGVPNQVITVTQDAALPAVALSATTLTVAAPANSSKSFDITSNTSWTVASSDAWLSASPTSGSADASIVLTAQANPTPSVRTATVTVTGLNVAPKTITVIQDAALPTLAVSATTLTVAAPANSTKTFDVTSNTNWTATSNAAWLALSSTTGSANATVTMTAQENPSITTRTAIVVVSAAGVPDQTITVTQEAGAATLAVSANVVTIAAPANSTKTIAVTSNTTWTIVSDQTWLTLSSAGGTANDTVTMTAQANPNVTTRTATVVVSAAGVPSQTITVSQVSTSATLSITPSTLSIASAANSTKTFDIISNTSWTLSSNAVWLKADSTSGTANKTIKLTAQANTTTNTRTTTVVVSVAGLPDQVVTVTQDGIAPVLSVTPTTLNVAAPADSKVSFDITSNTNWTTASGQTWLSTNGSGGFGNGKITLTAQANPNTTTRTTTVTVSAKNLPDQIVTVTQAALSIVMTVSTNALTIAAPASSKKTFELTSNTTWTVTSDQAWLTPTAAAGTGNATITLTALANTTNATRKANVTIKGTGAADITVVVTQDFVSGTNNLEDEKTAFAVYPNPTSDNLSIKLTNINTLSIIDKLNIFDLNGRTILSINAFDVQKTIDVSTLPTGVYSIQLMDNATQSISTRKFVKL